MASVIEIKGANEYQIRYPDRWGREAGSNVVNLRVAGAWEEAGTCGGGQDAASQRLGADDDDDDDRRHEDEGRGSSTSSVLEAQEEDVKAVPVTGHRADAAGGGLREANGAADGPCKMLLAAHNSRREGLLEPRGEHARRGAAAEAREIFPGGCARLCLGLAEGVGVDDIGQEGAEPADGAPHGEAACRSVNCVTPRDVTLAVPDVQGAAPLGSFDENMNSYDVTLKFTSIVNHKRSRSEGAEQSRRVRLPKTIDMIRPLHNSSSVGEGGCPDNEPAYEPAAGGGRAPAVTVNHHIPARHVAASHVSTNDTACQTSGQAGTAIVKRQGKKGKQLDRGNENFHQRRPAAANGESFPSHSLCFYFGGYILHTAHSH